MKLVLLSILLTYVLVQAAPRKGIDGQECPPIDETKTVTCPPKEHAAATKHCPRYDDMHGCTMQEQCVPEPGKKFFYVEQSIKI